MSITDPQCHENNALSPDLNNYLNIPIQSVSTEVIRNCRQAFQPNIPTNKCS